MARVTQKSVAQRAGVSQASVSLVLGGANAASLPEETVARIQTAARELGYVPNRLAQALKTRRTMTIACVVPDITNPFYPHLIRGVQGVAEAHGYDVIALNTDGSPTREQHFLQWALQGRVDGVVGVFFTLRAQALQILTENAIAVVRVEAARKAGGAVPIDDIFIDGRAAAVAVVDYLLSRGHRRIAIIAGAGGPEQVRIDGYRAAMIAAGCDPVVVGVPKFDEAAGRIAGRRILEMQAGITAIFAANDLLAIGIMLELRAQNLRIPDDIAVFGFDNISAAPLVTPPLSSVTQFQDRMGETAAQILLNRIDGRLEGAATVTEMPFELVLRGSA
ncbi:LacI family DNA-binding transcriptional regulator [Ketogulonicigenium vulgare]|uniref:LacI family transcriptional repressor n=1 Tax=Ketogulonicigenium vulgare (strain WSH-001) TaxID=759362 RepID=F9Y7U8_KETVW|nr:LacI family DNA-binding transcriptional regulator [Ketogulonicigenium vulgare]ADO41675.1 transcriptional regulator, LacI family [Ketogulonicigenium vulgare Y25]AEM39914.1 LacI family transcriptional repressor [Ketogulonicigenium vulgare WSH-001]ALJ80130.1 LacI family transcriptional regulator [Ketogulonicigenium vulgare]ANW32998.1 LacI family transcriptional regulator [Ketogulonicigenium vulgare]AOZ53607.1 transcriptional regulator, LacI family [Ketogulonicigenium vulgare]